MHGIYGECRHGDACFIFEILWEGLLLLVGDSRRSNGDV